jgi:uncharacterized membrane protein
VTPVVVRRERILTLPADVLWQLIEPVETLPAWLPFVVRSQHLGGKGLGRQQRVWVRLGRRHAEIDQEIVVYRPSQAIGWKHVAERVNNAPALSREVTTTVTIESMGPGTRIVLESRHTPASLGAAILLRLVAARRIGKAFDRALRTLGGVGDQ